MICKGYPVRTTRMFARLGEQAGARAREGGGV